MQLPYTNSNLLLWLDPSERFVYKDSSKKVSSVLNRVNGIPLIQNTFSKQPIWDATTITRIYF